MACKTPSGYGRSGSGAKPKELMLRGSLSGEPHYASILWADEQGISSEIFRSLSCFISSHGARGVGDPGTQHSWRIGLLLLSGLVNHNKLNFSSIFCNNRIILWCRMGHLINWQLRHQRDHINDNFGMEILVPDSDF